MEPAEVISISPTKRLVVDYDPDTECPLDWNDDQGVINLDPSDYYYASYFGTYNGGLSYAIQQAGYYGQDEFTAAQKYAKRNGLKVEQLTAQDYGRTLDAVIWTVDDDDHYLETEAFKSWLTGEVYNINLEELDTDSDIWDVTDSIGGCYLHDNYTALDVARTYFDLSEKKEITMAHNPDDEQVLTLDEYRERVSRLDWRAVYANLYPEYADDFARCTEQDYYDGPDAWAFDLSEKKNTKDTFTLKIELGNEAMQNSEDVAEALRTVSRRLEWSEDLSTSGKIYDNNGNPVGEWSFQ